MMLILRRPCTVDRHSSISCAHARSKHAASIINSHPTSDTIVLYSIRSIASLTFYYSSISSYFFPILHLFYRINASLMSLDLYIYIYRREIEIDFFFERISQEYNNTEMFSNNVLKLGENSWNRHKGFTTNKGINFSDLNRDLEALESGTTRGIKKRNTKSFRVNSRKLENFEIWLIPNERIFA